MTLDDILGQLFPAGHAVRLGPFGTVRGTAQAQNFGSVDVIGITGGTPLSIDGALVLAGHVLELITEGSKRPLIVLVDTSSQNMARRDELLGLNEFLAHLSKCLTLASAEGIFTLGVLYGHAAAGAFISTALSTQVLAAVPGAFPSVMDLPSISRVTKLPIETLTELSKTTPIFAPGLEPLFATGAVTVKWQLEDLPTQLAAALAAPPRPGEDERDATGLARKGRLHARELAQEVMAEAAAYG